jgi:putative ABC transport system permease protein
MKKHGFRFFFIRSVSQRMGRFATASVSVMLAVAVITGVAGLTLGIKDKLGSELSSYGANIIVSPEPGKYISDDEYDAISGTDNVDYAEGQVYGRADISGESVEVIGLDLQRLKARGWRLYDRLPEKSGEILAGNNLKDLLRLEQGKAVSLQGYNKRETFIISGFIEKGGAEDSSFIMSVEDARGLLGRDGAYSAVLVRGKAGKLEEITADINRGLPSVHAKSIRQVAVAEESLLDKMQMLMLLVGLVVLFAAFISVAGTVGANVIERREEIGLMKALGATRNNIRSFYVTESALIGIVGGIDGFILGYLFAQAVSWKAFGSFISIPLYIILLSVFAGLAISLFASHFPVNDALKYNPAVILREE